jgi:hypothetical protein
MWTWKKMHRGLVIEQTLENDGKVKIDGVSRAITVMPSLIAVIYLEK